MQHYGGGINTKSKTVTVTDSYFEDCVSTLKEGGALHIGGREAGSMATITGSTFKNCTAKNGGGALLSSHETLTIEGCNFYGCSSSASNGGAVYHCNNSREDKDKSKYSIQKTTTINNSIFSADPADNSESKIYCSADQNGGAIWTQAETVTLTGCTIEGSTANGKGGAVYLSKNIHISGKESNGTISGTIVNGEAIGSITNCKAANGSAVYVEDKATFSGNLVVSGNIVSNVNSGAIQAIDAGKLYFEGNVKVENNTCSADSTNKHDVLMQINGNTIINTTNVGLGSEAHIGVYVSDPYDAYTNHGQYGQPFGTYHNSDAGSSFLDAFFNDRDSELYGYQGETYIHWGFYVCKITDANGNTLKRLNGRDAVYQKLSQAFEEFTSVKDDSGATGNAVYIKMLVEDYALRQEEAISNFPVADVTLTTASRSDTEHPYRGTEGTVSTIYRTNSEYPLFDLNEPGAIFQLKDIILDGRKVRTATAGDYKLITASTGEIIVNSGTTLQFAKGDSGAAITAVDVTINGKYDTEKKEPTVKLINCTATDHGGAISTRNLTITNTSTTLGEYGTVFNNCTSANGGAIYANGTTVTMTGASFTGCSSTGEGGVLFHNYTGTESAATAITNCAFNDSEATGGEGGAVSSKAGTLTVEGSSFDTVKASGNGGAISHTGITAATITGTTFKACRTTGSGFGGSVYTGAKVVTLNGGSFENSTAANHGGALYCASSAADSAATVSGTSFKNCSTTLSNGDGGAIYANGGTLTLKNAEDKTAVKIDGCMTSTANGAVGRGGAVYMNAGVLNVTENTVISSCYADKGGAIYLPAGVTMNLTDSPEFSENGYSTQSGSTVDATSGACIYLVEGSRINLSGSPKFSRNILPNKPRVTNGGVTDFVRQDVYMAGYPSTTAFDTNAESIYVTGELTGDTIWIWPEQDPHKKPNTQFAKIDINGEPLSDEKLAETLSHFRNALADGKDVPPDYNHTECDNGEYLAGVQFGEDYNNVYWDKMYVIEFKKKDNKGVAVPDAEFTLYKELACTTPVATAVSADGETDTDAQGKLLARGTVEFTSIRIGAYYMKETKTPTSFKENDATYLVLVGTPYLSPNNDNSYLWNGDGPLKVTDAANLVAQHTTNAGRYYGIFPLDKDNNDVLRAVLRANLASSNVGIQNIRDDYQASFMKVDGSGDPLPGAAFTIYTAILDSNDQPATFEDGYPKLMRWSRDGENYPDPVVSADGTASFKDKENKKLSKGTVYFRELPLGTYYLLETGYPERNGSGRRTFYAESDRVFKLDLEEVTGSKEPKITLSEWKGGSEGNPNYEPLLTNSEGYYVVSNKEVVCKLTDSSDNLLYVEGHNIWENKESKEDVRLFPAIYATLEEGFEAAQQTEKTFVYANGSTADVDEKKALKLKVLKDFELSEEIKAVFYESDRNITFTTAETRATNDRYIFSTTRTTDTSRAEIKRTYSETKADKNEGALITVTAGAKLTLQNIKLNGQNTNYNGRAIHVKEGSLTILNKTQFQNFQQDSGNGGAVLMDSGTTLSVNGGANRSAIFTGNTAANGGAIYVSAGCKVDGFENAQFTSNTATDGGAINLPGNESTPYDFTNIVFTSNSSSSNGGAVLVNESCSLTLNNCTFTKNEATNGGALSAGSGVNVTFTSGSISDNKATGNGGAFYVGSTEGKTGVLTVIGGSITGNTATANGGAVYADDYAEVTISGGSITSNTAALGSALYADNNAKATITNASITGNNASATNGGAINVGGLNARLYFGGTPTVFDNFGTLGNTQQMNLVLSEDYNDVINTTADGLSDGVIGVFVIESNSEIFENHGLPGKPFGTFGDQNKLNPQVFRSDHALSLYGVRNEADPADKRIYWVDVLCKLTDNDNNILYQDIDLTINGKKETRKAQAVYARITEPVDKQNNPNGFDASHDGFDAAKGTLYTRDGKAYTETGIKLKMLKDVSLDKTIQYSGSRLLTFTTAEIEKDLSEMRNTGDYFLFHTERTNDNLDKALITRAFNENSMINDAGTGLTLTSIILDGNKDKNYTSGNGGIVNVQNNSALIVTDGAILQNSNSTGNGGAIYVDAGTLSVNNGSSLINCQATNGGGIYATGNVNVVGGSITGNSAVTNGGALFVTGDNTQAEMSGGTISNNGATNGGAIYVTETGRLTMTGGTIGGTTAEDGKTTTNGNQAVNGAGVYLLGTANLTGGTISYNEATTAGGGIYAQGTITANGATIENNTAGSSENGGSAGNGGGLYLRGLQATLTFESGNIQSNSAVAFGGNGGLGGGVYVDNNASITLSGGTIGGASADDGNQAVDGAGVYLLGSANLTSGTISNNKATTAGGGIYAQGEVNLEGATINNNSAGSSENGGSAGNGGGLYLSGLQATLTMTGGNIRANSATAVGGNGGLGGGVYVGENAGITLSGGTIGGKIVDPNGGTTANGGNQAVDGAGVYLASGASLNMSGTNTEISQNAASRNGGGIYAQGEVILEGATIKNNSAGSSENGGSAGNGGGLYLSGTKAAQSAVRLLTMETRLQMVQACTLIQVQA